MLSKLKSLQHSIFLQTGFQKGRLSLGTRTYMQVSPHVLLTFTKADKQMEIVEIRFSDEPRKIPSPGIISVSVYEMDQQIYLDKVNTSIELDSKGSYDTLRWSHLFCYFDLEEHPSLRSNPVPEVIFNAHWDLAVLMIFHLSDTYRIVVERGDMGNVWEVYLIDLEKNPGFEKEFLGYREFLQGLQVF